MNQQETIFKQMWESKWNKTDLVSFWCNSEVLVNLGQALTMEGSVLNSSCAEEALKHFW